MNKLTAPKTTSAYVGVDVAKADLQAHLNGAQVIFSNTPAGHRELCRKLQRITGAHVILEATGGYEQPLVQALHQANIPVSVINPAWVRASAQAKGQRAKTDAIDASLLTEYGERYAPRPTSPQTPAQQKLAALTQWLKQLIESQAVAKGQGEHHTDSYVRARHEALLNHYEKQIQAVEGQLAKLLEENRPLQQRAEALDEIEGVGLRSALVVLSHMPELGYLNRGKVAALAGLAPWTRESGTLKGLRCIGGGRAEIRTALYMCSLSAVRCNPTLKAFYQRLIARGKPGKVALTAVMRKLLIFMNAKLKSLAVQEWAHQQQKVA
jgi:transposase